MRSPCARASTIESKMALMITSESLRERCGNLLFTSSIKSLFVITSPHDTRRIWIDVWQSPFSLLEQGGRPFVAEPTSLRGGETPADRCKKDLLPPTLLFRTRIVDGRILFQTNPLSGEFDGVVQRPELVY